MIISLFFSFCVLSSVFLQLSLPPKESVKDLGFRRALGWVKRGRSSLSQECELGPGHVPSWGLWLLLELCLGQKVRWGGWLEQEGGSEEGLEAANHPPFLQPDSPRDPENGSRPQSLHLGGNKGTVVGDPGSGLHAVGSVPPDPCPSPRGTAMAWVWDRWSQKGPFCDARGRQGTAASRLYPLSAVLLHCVCNV